MTISRLAAILFLALLSTVPLACKGGGGACDVTVAGVHTCVAYPNLRGSAAADACQAPGTAVDACPEDGRVLTCTAGEGETQVVTSFYGDRAIAEATCSAMSGTAE